MTSAQAVCRSEEARAPALRGRLETLWQLVGAKGAPPLPRPPLFAIWRGAHSAFSPPLQQTAAQHTTQHNTAHNTAHNKSGVADQPSPAQPSHGK